MKYNFFSTCASSFFKSSCPIKQSYLECQGNIKKVIEVLSPNSRKMGKVSACVPCDFLCTDLISNYYGKINFENNL